MDLSWQSNNSGKFDLQTSKKREVMIIVGRQTVYSYNYLKPKPDSYLSGE